jgi:hypothetical protein
MGVTVIKVAIAVGLLAASLAFAFWMEHLQQRDGKEEPQTGGDGRPADDRRGRRRLRRAS